MGDADSDRPNLSRVSGTGIPARHGWPYSSARTCSTGSPRGLPSPAAPGVQGRLSFPKRAPRLGPWWATAAVLALAAVARADDFDGVQPAALDQPRIRVVVRPRSTRGQLLAATAAHPVDAYLDTGASGLLLSEKTAAALGVGRESVDGSEARFHDVGVGGGDAFAVSDPLTVAVENTPLAAVPGRAQVGPIGAGPSAADALAPQLLGDAAVPKLDVIGMPVMVGRVVVMDVRGVNRVADKIRTTLLDGRRSTTASHCRRHVRLSAAAFNAYTTTTPPTADPPTLSANPFIGPSPVPPAGSRPATPPPAGGVPPVTAQHGNRKSTGSWLLDTGAATSMISKAQAARLGVTYVPGTETTDAPQLAGVPADRQFTLTVGGIGGQRRAAGFYLDRLTLATTEGRPITYLHAPVLVADVTATAASADAGGASVTLDGVFGMNFLVASMKVADGVLPDPQSVHPGPYRTVVFDQPKGLLGLD